MSTFTGVARIIGVVVPRLPRLGFIAIQTNSRLNNGQRKAVAAFHQTLLKQGVPADLAAELADRFPKLNIRDIMGNVPGGGLFAGSSRHQ